MLCESIRLFENRNNQEGEHCWGFTKRWKGRLLLTAELWWPQCSPDHLGALCLGHDPHAGGIGVWAIATSFAFDDSASTACAGKLLLKEKYTEALRKKGEKRFSRTACSYVE